MDPKWNVIRQQLIDARHAQKPIRYTSGNHFRYGRERTKRAPRIYVQRMDRQHIALPPTADKLIILVTDDHLHPLHRQRVPEYIIRGKPDLEYGGLFRPSMNGTGRLRFCPVDKGVIFHIANDGKARNVKRVCYHLASHIDTAIRDYFEVNSMNMDAVVTRYVS